MGYKKQSGLAPLEPKKAQMGFTILELMIAISVFTIAIVLVTTGVIAVGRYYQQGASKAKLLTAAREIHSQFTQDVQYSATDITQTTVNIIDTQYGGSYNAVCMGSTRYLISTDNGLSGQTKTDYGRFISDNNGQVCGSISLNAPQQPLPEGSSGSYDSNQALDAKVVTFQITPSAPSIYTLTTRFVIGSKSMFSGSTSDVGATEGDYTQSCQSNILGSEFCAVVTMTSTVARKVIN
jgi:prepilin-type N-terminal cleavage/methylation domain-containing protein